VPGWKEIAAEIAATGTVYDLTRRKYLKRLEELTGRNVIIYYSAWLQKPYFAPMIGQSAFAVSDVDKSSFMSVIHNLDRTRGLDLVLHTPGGDAAATESLVQYLHEMFGTNIRAIVPQLAMSAGTMIACACKQIVMGAHSSIGPIDPQIMGLPAHGVIEEFNRARDEIAADPKRIPLWQPIIAKYTPTFIGECEKALKWSREIVEEWLREGMFAGQEDAQAKAAAVVEALGDHEEQRSHARHISLKKARAIGLDVLELEAEENQELQDAVLSVHHATLQTIISTPAVKLVENHLGVAVQMMVTVQSQPQPGVPVPPPSAPGGVGTFDFAPGAPLKVPEAKPRRRRKR
jgi:ATP-dependent protease ClpP protease subunit